MRAADVLVEALVECGVRHVFGMPGSHSATLYDAFASEASIGTILIRNEQAGAFAADGYARVQGRPGVVCTTAGPGATNALTGVAEAWGDSVPLVLLAGQVNADRMHEECGAYHEIDLEGILRPVTKFCATVRDPSETGDLARRAYSIAISGRPRPTALILPQDLMRVDCPPLETTFRPNIEESPRVDADAIARAAKLLTDSKRPIILAGGGALWSGAGAEVRAVARTLHAPVVTTLNGKGLIDERDASSLGHARSSRANVVLAEADAMLAIGCRFTEIMTGWRTMPVPRNLVQIDIDAGQIGVNHPVSVGIEADAKDALEAMLELISPRDEGGWGTTWDRARLTRPSRPEWLIETLRQILSDETPVFTDACEMGYRMHTDYPAHAPRTFFYPSNYISLGWGFPAAVGAAVALGRNRHVVSVSGDGGFVMTAQELATAARYELPVIAIVHNDSAYGAIKNLQKRLHGGRYRDVDLNNPDFPGLAAAFGVPGTRATDAATLRRALQQSLECPGPSLIEVPDHWRTIRP